MARKSREERKQKLRERTQRSSDERDQKITTSAYLDMAKVREGQKIVNFDPKTEKGKTKLIDIVPFEITQDWYPKLKTFSGTTTKLEPGDIDYKLEVPIHYRVGPDNQAFLCLREAFGRPCRICQDRFDEWEKSDPDKDLAASLKPKWRTIYNVYDYDSGDGDEPFMLWDFSYHNGEKLILEEAEISSEGQITFSDLDEGRSIEYRPKIEKFGKHEYIVMDRIQFIEREPYDDNILDETFPLDKMLVIPTPEEVTKAYLGLDEEEVVKKDEPDNSRSSRSRGRGGSDKTETETLKDDECPNGGLFGVDCNELDECPDCDDDLFNSCSEYGEAASKVEPETEKESSRRGSRRSEKKSEPEAEKKESSKRGSGRSTRRNSGESDDKKTSSRRRRS